MEMDICLYGNRILLIFTWCELGDVVSLFDAKKKRNLVLAELKLKVVAAAAMFDVN